jgi:hypothetical protein
MGESLDQAKIGRRIVHPIEQRVAGRAEYPNPIRRGVCLAPPRPIPAMLRLVRHIKNARLAARLTLTGGFRMPSVKPFEVAVWPQLLTGAGMVLANLVRLLHIELGARLAGAFSGTPRRAMPFVALTLPARKELRSALATMASLKQELARLPVVPKFLLTIRRTELVPSVRRLEAGAALPAMFDAFHA